MWQGDVKLQIVEDLVQSQQLSGISEARKVIKDPEYDVREYKMTPEQSLTDVYKNDAEEEDE